MTTDHDGLRILLLEDEPVILMDLSFAVEDRGAVPVGAISVDAAMSEIEAGPIHAAVLDVNIGQNVTCESVAKRLTELGVPFVLHSGDLVRQGELIARIEAEVIPKPSDSTRVVARILHMAKGEE